MKLDDFVREREPAWRELDSLIRDAGGKPEHLGPERVRRLGSLYRSAAADLAAARRRFPGELAVSRLEQLVTRARHVVYDADVRRTSIRTFFGRTYWRRIREHRSAAVLALCLFVGPSVLAGAWGWRDPAAAARLVPTQYRAVTEPRDVDGGLGVSTDQSAEFAARIFTNNIRVAFFAFAGGITLGLLTGWVLVFNGLLVGTLMGLAAASGNGQSFLRLVVPHGLLELSCIAVAGIAGIRMGSAIVAPGHRRRSAALQQQARAAAELALGTAPWLVLAGLVEGFVTPQALPLGGAVFVGLLIAVPYWALIALRGGPEPSAADTR